MGDIPALVRPEFFDGQRLTAADLAAVQAYQRELRRLHNRTLHSWGIVNGLAAAGQRGDRAVTIRPGFALDCQGRELIVSEILSLPVPAVAGAASGGPAPFYLTVSYAADADLPISETRTGVCQGSGAVRRPEASRIRWQAPHDISAEGRYRRGLDVILATIQVQNCQLAAPVSTAERRDARPADQPFVAAGATPEGKTAWTFWLEAATVLGVQTTVDTSAGGFGASPDYLAHVVGNRVLREPGGTAQDPIPGQLVDGFSRISNAGPRSFVLQMLLPRDLSLGAFQLNPPAVFVSATLTRLRKELEWHVVWMGVEG
jgi:hypothetical protein